MDKRSRLKIISRFVLIARTKYVNTSKPGRLLIGPWYVLPDEFLAHPEALIRNLLCGRRVARQFGEPMPVGYIPDTFGHISQLAQIFSGFGIDNVVVWRGLPSLPNEFLWQAPDGTTALTINLREGYGNLAWAPNDPDGFTAAARRVAAQLAPHATTANILLMDGTDHLEARPDLPDLIAAAKRAPARRNAIGTHHPCRSLSPRFVPRVRNCKPSPANSACQSARMFCPAFSRRGCGSSNATARQKCC